MQLSLLRVVFLASFAAVSLGQSTTNRSKFLLRLKCPSNLDDPSLADPLCETLNRTKSDGKVQRLQSTLEASDFTNAAIEENISTKIDSLDPTSSTPAENLNFTESSTFNSESSTDDITDETLPFTLFSSIGGFLDSTDASPTTEPINDAKNQSQHSSAVENRTNSTISGTDDEPTVEEEIDKTFDAGAFGDSFDGEKMLRCNGLVHPIFKILSWMNAKGISKEFEKNRCTSDYHGACKTSWKNCNLRGTHIFCPKSCTTEKLGCPAIDSFGYVDSDRPTFVGDINDNITVCSDNANFSCSTLRDRGDCFALASNVWKICPRTCHFCAKSRPYVPFSPAVHRIVNWLRFFDNGKYAKFANFMNKEMDFVVDQALTGKCQEERKVVSRILAKNKRRSRA